ncbi:MAG TPA: signal peptide peptidase SppA [Candidatus Limnocylindrales bacterium]|nr:signal peptide peptidase SppA [Candidatus Limnocylindrales bacterium]
MDTAPYPSGMVPPPPVITAPPPPKPRRGRGWMIFAIILLVLLLISLFGNFAWVVSQAINFKGGLSNGISREVGPNLDECLIKDNDASSKIAVVTVDGIISGQTVDQSGNNLVDVIKAQLDRAKDDRRVKAVILKVDSPGGEVLASDEIYRAINDFQKDSSKPVVCSMGSLAASGGYYISSPCRWIVANDLTITGSIGVILHTWNYRGLMDKIGLRPEVFKSGKFKDMLSGERETNEIPAEERVMVQGLIDETYQKFKDVVAAGRDAAHARNKKDGRPLALDWTNYADGRVLSGTQAYDLGFVDQLGDFQDAVDRAKQIAGIRNANLIEYRERYDLSNFLRLLGQTELSHSVKLDLGMDLPKLQAGELYFLSPTFIN